jgi:pimeloyl-ACP methyl ester carboxylesterase
VVPFTSYETMAAHYVDEIRKLQPEGPYFLGGYSFGGRVAVYVARQLRAAGEDVALLALLDPYSLNGRHWMTLDAWLERHGRPSSLKRLAEMARYLRFRVHRGLSYFYHCARRAVLFTIWEMYRKTGKTLPFSLRRPDHANRCIRLTRNDMSSYDGDVTYFKAGFNRTSRAHPDS